MNKAPMQTKEELQIVKDFIMLPILASDLENDIKKIADLKLKRSEIFINLIKMVQNQIHSQLWINRTFLRQHGLKVYEPKETPIGIEASYLCRGYPHAISLLWSFIDAQNKTKLSHFLKTSLTSGAENHEKQK